MVMLRHALILHDGLVHQFLTLDDAYTIEGPIRTGCNLKQALMGYEVSSETPLTCLWCVTGQRPRKQR